MLSQMNFGADVATFSATQAMTAFEQRFGELDPSTQTYALKPTYLSLLNSLTYIGQVFGVIFGGWIGRTRGRKWSFYTMCIWALLSATLLITAKSRGQMLAGRVINYIYIGQELATVPVMQSEIVPAHVRGLVVSTYQLGTMLGAFCSALICYGCSTLSGEKSFRIPFGLFYVVPCILLATLHMCPESPRWLIVRDRHEDALQSLRAYRVGRFSDEEIQREFDEQVAMISVRVEKGSFAELWKGTNLRRTLIVVGANVCAQLTGQSFASKYGVIFLSEIGTVDPFVLNIVNNVLFILVCAVAMTLADRVGRRPLLLTGCFMQAGAMLVIGGFGTMGQPLSYGYRAGLSAMVTIFYSGFCFGWATIYHVLTSEIPNSRMRDMTYVTASVCTVITQFAVSFSIPYLYYEPYAALGPKIGLIFGSLAACTFVFVFFLVPECRKLTLEEVDYLFVQGTKIWDFGKMRHSEVIPESLIAGVEGKLGEVVAQREVTDARQA
jgi:MFS transporter, SP family, sugar:H+ symporter